MSGSPPPAGREADRVIYGGLLGLAVAGVIQLLEKDTLDWPLAIGTYAFAVAVPLLAVGLISDYARRAGRRVPLTHEVVGMTGAAASVIGFGALFFHLGAGAGITFILLALVSLVLVRRI